MVSDSGAQGQVFLEPQHILGKRVQQSYIASSMSFSGSTNVVFSASAVQMDRDSIGCTLFVSKATSLRSVNSATFYHVILHDKIHKELTLSLTGPHCSQIG